MSTDVRKPEDWASALGFTIHDPDGWRGRDAKDFNEPVTAEEFDRRAQICTISFHSNTFVNELPKAVALAQFDVTAQVFCRQRRRLIVEIDLDPVPGWGNDPDDHVRYLQRHLDSSMGHYHPTVTLDGSAS